MPPPGCHKRSSGSQSLVSRATGCAPSLLTSYDHPDPAQGNIVNQVKLDYDSYRNLTRDWQDHDGSVNDYTLSVQYNYSDPGYGTLRRTDLIYPNGDTLNYHPHTEIDEALNRPGGLTVDSNNQNRHIASYDYLGTSRLAKLIYEQPGVFLDNLALDGDQDSGTPLTGSDRFGRPTNVLWKDTNYYETKAHLQYGYDRASQRTWRRDLLATTYGQKQDTAYLYDLLGQKPRRLVGVLDRSTATWGAAPKARGAGLSQLLQSAKGLLNLNQTAVGAIPAHQENWQYDQLGNWLNHKTQEDGNLLFDQNRTHNNLNEILTIDGTSEDISYDANGNMTKVPDPTDGHRLLVWDGWNRLATVRLPDGTLIQTNRYDALTRRITSNPSPTESLSDERHYYYNDQWRPLQETQGASSYAATLYCWGVRSRDDLIMRAVGNFSNTSSDTAYYLLDAMDPIAILTISGSVKHRLAYTPFGEPEWLNANFQPTPPATNLTFLFHAQFTDPETGYQNYGYRFYLPSLGRWLSPDPIGVDGSLNLYTFAGNSGVSRSDVLGLYDWEPLEQAIHEAGVVALTLSIADVKLRQTAWDRSVDPRKGDRPFQGFEYGGRICRNCVLIEGVEIYTYYRTGPVTQSHIMSIDPTMSPPCKGDDITVGIYHSHPNAGRLSGFGAEYTGDRKISEQGKDRSLYKNTGPDPLPFNEQLPPMTPIGATYRRRLGDQAIITTDIYNPKVNGGSPHRRLLIDQPDTLPM